TGDPQAITEDELIKRSGSMRTNIQRALKELVSEGSVKRTGGGKRGDPFRYFIPQSSQRSPTEELEEVSDSKKPSNQTMSVRAETGFDGSEANSELVSAQTSTIKQGRKYRTPRPRSKKDENVARILSAQTLKDVSSDRNGFPEVPDGD